MASLYSAMIQVFILLSLQDQHASPFSPHLIFALRIVAHWNNARASTCGTYTPWKHNVCMQVDTGCGKLGNESLGQFWINLDCRKKFKCWIVSQLEDSLTSYWRFVSCKMWHTANIGRCQYLKEKYILPMSTRLKWQHICLWHWYLSNKQHHVTLQKRGTFVTALCNSSFIIHQSM